MHSKGVTSLVAVVTPRTDKIKMASVFLREERICYTVVYTLPLS